MEFKYNDIGSVEKIIKENENEIAAIITTPISHPLGKKVEMPKKSSIALFIAATSALAISSPVNSGDNEMGGLKEWNTDMEIDADFVLDKEVNSNAPKKRTP